MKETIELIKKLWSNKRYRSLAILLIYGIFFAFVFLFISTANKQVYIENKYNYYQIIINDDIVYDSLDNTITYSNNVYSIDDLPEELKQYDIKIFNPDKIFKLIDKATLESTNYLNKINTYIIDITEFDDSLEGILKINTYGEKVNEILVILNEYYGYDVRIKLRS